MKNASAAVEDEDDDADELVFEEFLGVLAMICDLKIPEAKRGGERSDGVTTLKQRARALEAGERKLRDGLAGAPVAARGYGEPERQARRARRHGARR